MQIISVVNHKGGVAKTTTSVNLSATLAEGGRRVLLVDMDPQASASVWLGIRTKGQAFLKALLEGHGFENLVKKTASGVDLVPSGPAFASFEKLATAEPGGETRLRTALKNLPRKWDRVFIDCPPSLNLASVNALVASNCALVPVSAQVLSLEPLARLMDTMWQVRERLNPDLQLSGIFASRVDLRTSHGSEVVEHLREKFGNNVYDTFIRESAKLAEAPGFQKPITLYAPTSPGAKDYRALAHEFEHRLRKELAKEKA